MLGSSKIQDTGAPDKVALSKYGAKTGFQFAVAFPWLTSNVARGIMATDENKRSDGLLRLAQVDSILNIYQVPIVYVQRQYPATANGAAGAGSKRLPLNMVAPKLAWSPS